MDRATRETVSHVCLFSKPLPRTLEMLWEAAEADDPFLTKVLALTLLTSRDELNVGYEKALLDKGDDIAANVRAHWRIFERLAFFARQDGTLLAFDMQAGSTDDPPVVVLDSEGQYRWLGINAAEAIYRLAEHVEESDAALEWLLRHGIPLAKPGELGSTTGHLASLEELHASLYWELLGEPRRRSPTREMPANQHDALSWFLRPGEEVLSVLRQVLNLDDDAYPKEQWFACDGEGRVKSIWVHPVDDLSVNGIRFGTPREDVLAELGKPNVDWVDCGRYDVGSAYILYEFEHGVVDRIFIGLDQR